MWPGDLPKNLACYCAQLKKLDLAHASRDERGHQEQASNGDDDGLFARFHPAPLHRGQSGWQKQFFLALRSAANLFLLSEPKQPVENTQP